MKRTCKHCPKTFDTMKELRNHFNAEHPKEFRGFKLSMAQFDADHATELNERECSICAHRGRGFHGSAG